MCAAQKHLFLDSKLNFNHHVDNDVNECNKNIGIIKRLSVSISRNILLIICKFFVRLHLYYCGIIYD